MKTACAALIALICAAPETGRPYPHVAAGSDGQAAPDSIRIGHARALAARPDKHVQKARMAPDTRDRRARARRNPKGDLRLIKKEPRRCVHRGSVFGVFLGARGSAQTDAGGAFGQFLVEEALIEFRDRLTLKLIAFVEERQPERIAHIAEDLGVLRPGDHRAR